MLVVDKNLTEETRLRNVSEEVTQRRGPSVEMAEAGLPG